MSPTRASDDGCATGRGVTPLRRGRDGQRVIVARPRRHVAAARREQVADCEAAPTTRPARAALPGDLADGPGATVDRGPDFPVADGAAVADEHWSPEWPAALNGLVTA